jgi:serine/threonine-protein kinase RsbW
MATVELSFTPLAAHIRTARLVATAVARRSGVDESLLDEVRLAVGEACSRAVESHQRHCPAEPVRLALSDLAGRFEVEVTDTSAPAADGPGGDSAPAGDRVSAGDSDLAGSGAAPASRPGTAASDRAGLQYGLGIAVIAGLADEVQISETYLGTRIKMSWPSSGPAR